MSQWTPGPWTIGGATYPLGILAPHRFGAGDPEVIAQIGVDIMTPESTDECEANARLIALAPEMAQGLRAIVQVLNGSQPMDPRGALFVAQTLLARLDA